MKNLTRILRRTRFWLGAGRHGDDLAAEIEHHRARMQAALEADGLAPAEAAARSRRAMGNVTLAREDARGVWIAVGLERAWRDAVYGMRALRREPAFALTAVLTLTLGIATTTTVFSVADAELWRPLPFREPEHLVAVYAKAPGANGATESVSGPDFLDWQSQSRLAEYAAETGFERRVLRRGSAESVAVRPVTANYFQMLGLAPRLGRPFIPGQDDRARVAILTDAGWRRLFNSDPSVIGVNLSISGADYTIVGALAGQHLEFDGEPDFYLALDAAGEPFRDRAARLLTVFGRVRSGAGIPQAQAELQAISTRIAEAFPAGHAGHRVELMDLRRYSVSYNWRPFFFFLGAAAIVLLLSCVNVANLLLARALRRQREFAIRGALGGGRGALIRQLIVEGALLAVPSAAAAALFSLWALKLFVAQIPAEFLERGGHFTLDGRITLFVIAVSGVTTILLSLAPLVFARRLELNLMLGQGGRTAGRSPGQVRARNALLVTQLTLTLVLMVAAGLFVTSFTRLVGAPLGFDPADRLALRVGLSGPLYKTDAAVRGFADRLLEAARATPGVQDAAVGSSSPLLSGPVVRLVAADRPRPPAGDEDRAIIRAANPAYFRTLGITHVAGRPFTDADADGAPRVAIINEYLAGRLFPGESAVGQRLDLVPGARTVWTRRPGVVLIVGVIRNVKDVGINEVEFGNLYVPFAQAPAPNLELVVRSSMPAGRLAAPLRAIAAGIDPALPVARAETLTDRVDVALQGDRFNLVLIAAFAVIAILLATVGIYGAMACAVQERAREFGVRLALGQPPAAILRGTVWQSARFGLLGGAIGLAIALVLARALGNALYLVRGEHTGLLYGVRTTDPTALVSAVAALVVVATLSGIIPARQATKVDPLIALRNE